MLIQQIIDKFGAFIVGFSGGGAIVFGLSSWLGKVWANRILENEKALHSKEIESYKKQLETELAKLKAYQEKALYVSKTQYDKEYSIYFEIWEAMHECILFTFDLFLIVEDIPIDEKEFAEFRLKRDIKKIAEEKSKKYSVCVNAWNDFSKKIDKYAPFYREDFYNNFVEIRSMCKEILGLFYTYEIQCKNYDSDLFAKDNVMDRECRQNIGKIEKQIENKENHLKKEIREYLLSLQLK